MRVGLRMLGTTVLIVTIAACDDLPTGPADLRPMTVRAFNVADWSASGYSSPQGLSALDEIAEVGANTAVFIHTIYQEDRFSNELVASHPSTPRFSSLATAFARATTSGLDVILKAHVDVLDGSWRGFIDPEDPLRWFASYRGAVMALAEFAEDNGVDQLVIGTELVSTLTYEDRWREVAAGVRGVFDGQICYAASWDEMDQVPFWDAMDVVGVNFYFPVMSRPSASRFEILAGWQPWLERLDSFRRRVGRTVVLTEIGYMSRDGAGMAPADYDLDAPIDLQEQADLYWAALQAVSGEEWIEGICWWNWEVRAAGGPADAGYTPRGKPALEELRAVWGPGAIP